MAFWSDFVFPVKNIGLDCSVVKALMIDTPTKTENK